MRIEPTQMGRLCCICHLPVGQHGLNANQVVCFAENDNVTITALGPVHGRSRASASSSWPNNCWCGPESGPEGSVSLRPTTW